MNGFYIGLSTVEAHPNYARVFHGTLTSDRLVRVRLYCGQSNVESTMDGW